MSDSRATALGGFWLLLRLLRTLGSEKQEEGILGISLGQLFSRLGGPWVGYI